MRIVLTGVTGQVGRALAGTLEGLCHEVGQETSQGIGQEISQVIPADRSVLNLAEPGTLSDALDRLAPDLIVNPAAYTEVDRAEDEREPAFIVNAESPGVMARWASRRGVPLLHFSTDYVFDGRGDLPWREDSPTGPLSAYGASKLAGEEAICAAKGPHLIVRTSWVYAAQGANFLRTIARLARERAELKVVADQFGAPTSARVIANAIGELIAADPRNLPERFARAQGLVNLAAAGETSWHGFATSIVEGLKKRGVVAAVERVLPLRTEDYPTKARRPLNSRLDLTRLGEVFGIATPSWRSALDAELDLLVDELTEDTKVRGGLLL